MDAVGRVLILLKGHDVFGKDHPLPLEMLRQGGVAEDIFLIDVVLVVVHGAVAQAVGDVVAQAAAPPRKGAGEGRVIIREKDTAAKAEVLVKQSQHFFGEVFAVFGEVQGEPQHRRLPSLW